MLTWGWFWIIAAIVLGMAETILPGYILLGFSVGAVLAGLGLFAGILPSVGWTLLVFAVGSALGWWGLKRIFNKPDQQPKIWKTDINDN